MGASTGVERAIIKRTRKARKTAGLKVAAISAALGISPSAYRRFETDEVLPGDLIFTFCEITRCSPQYLATGLSVSRTTPAIVLAPPNRCGAPCAFGPFWCRASCELAKN